MGETSVKPVERESVKQLSATPLNSIDPGNTHAQAKNVMNSVKVIKSSMNESSAIDAVIPH